MDPRDPAATFSGWPAVLRQLIERRDLTRSQARAAMTVVLTGEAAPAQIAAFAVALRMKGESTDELAGLLDAMLDAATLVPLDDAQGVVDTCGTGGDGSHTINVSTLAALTVAGAGGRVCKHGGRAASSACGSADLLEALGVAIEVDGATVARCVEQVGIGFCFAPRFHAAMRHAGPTRRELGVATAFNFLGPIANPGRVGRQVVGVSDATMAPRMIAVLAANGAQRAMVVHGHDGLDELSTVTASTVVELSGAKVATYDVDPRHYGLAPASSADLVGGDPATNAGLARRVLAGEPGAHQDIVVLNAAAALVVGGLADDLGAGIELARASLTSGSAARVLDQLVATSNAPSPPGPSQTAST